MSNAAELETDVRVVGTGPTDAVIGKCRDSSTSHEWSHYRCASIPNLVPLTGNPIF